MEKAFGRQNKKRIRSTFRLTTENKKYADNLFVHSKSNFSCAQFSATKKIERLEKKLTDRRETLLLDQIAFPVDIFIGRLLGEKKDQLAWTKKNFVNG